MAGVEQTDMAARDVLHLPGEGTDFGRRQQRVDVVLHHYIHVQLAAGAEQRLIEHMRVSATVFLIEKAGQAAVAAPHNVLRNAGKIGSWLSGRAERMATT